MAETRLRARCLASCTANWAVGGATPPLLGTSAQSPSAHSPSCPGTERSGATAILPYSARAREGAPVAAPVDWEELDDFASGAAFSVRDAAKLIERAGSRRLQGWGLADQVLPDL